MLCRMLVIAANLVLASLSGAPSYACTNDKYQCEPNEAAPDKPLLFEEYVDRVFNRKPPADPLAESAVKRDDRQRASSSRKPAVVTPPAAAISSPNRGVAEVPTDVVPVVVRTTSEIVQGATSVSVISSEEWNEIDRLVAAQDAEPQRSTVGSGRAERAALATETPRPQPAGTMLELVLMTFSGALAAVTALRLFAA